MLTDSTRLRLPRVALAHLYATGPYHPGAEHPHGLLHIGLLPLTPGARPRTWLLNPERAFGDAVRKASGVNNREAKDAPTWADQQPTIQAAFAEFDALLILDRAGQPGPERTWLDAVVLAELERPPVLIGLDELTAFWLPADPLDDADDLLDHLLRPDEKWQKTLDFQFKQDEPRLPAVLACMRRAVRQVLASVLRPHGPAGKADSPRWQPALAALETALAPLDRRRLFELRAQRLLRALAYHPSCCDEPAPPDGQAALALQPLRPPEGPAYGLQPDQARKLLCEWLTDWRTRAADTGLTADALTDAIGGAPLPPTGAELASVFKYLGEHRPDWKPRPAQEQYAAFVADAIGGRGPYALEAGTGTGKTFGYLVPALEYLRKTSGGRVIVATSTKNLQDQIVSGELPALLGPKGNRNPLYKNSIRAAVLKGKNCYVCADALSRAADEALAPTADWRAAFSWLYLALRLRDTEGEIEGIAPAVTQRLAPALGRLLRATAADKACRHDNSDELPECTYPIHRRRAEAANLIITNHHKLALLPPKVRENGGICIIDEADRFPDNFRGALSRRFDAREVATELIGALLGGEADATGKTKTGLLARLNERLQADDNTLAAHAYRVTDQLALLRATTVADPDDDPTDQEASLDRQLEAYAQEALSEADLWAQTAEALADTPLAADALTELDRLLTEAATQWAALRRWRAIRAVRAATRTAETPLQLLADALRRVGAALLGDPHPDDPGLPYPPDDEVRWQEAVELADQRPGSRWIRIDYYLQRHLQRLVPVLEAAATAVAPLRELIQTALPPPDAGDDDERVGPPPSDPDKSLRERAARLAGQVLEASQLIRVMLAEFPARAHLHTIQRDGGSAHHPADPLAWRLTRLPYDLAPHLYTPPDPGTGLPPAHLAADPTVPLLDTFRSVVFTSATLYVEGELTYFRRLLDLPVPFQAEARIRSPFHYETAAVGALPHFLAPYDSSWPRLEKQIWQHTALQTLLPLLLALDGRTLILFTSNDEMRAAAEWLGPRLAAHDVELLVQNGASQWEIRRFRRIEQSVLLGVDRMWTGVDFAGLTLAHVVVWRVPFPMVGDPLISHRKQYESSKVYWDGFYYPSTRLKLRQGFGRLIRRETDRGGFLLLDSRLSAAAPAAKHHHLLAELEISLTEYGSAEALYGEFVPELLKITHLKEDFKRRGWTVKNLLGAG